MPDGPTGRIVFSEAVLKDRIEEIGRRIDKDYAGKDLVLVCVLKGSLYFFADLSRAIGIPIHLDFIAIGGFAGSTKINGVVRIIKDLDQDITGRHVLLIEDIVRTGLTTAYLVQNLEARRPASVKVCSLLVNPSQLMINVPIAYQGFEVPSTSRSSFALRIFDLALELRLPRSASMDKPCLQNQIERSFSCSVCDPYALSCTVDRYPHSTLSCGDAPPGDGTSRYSLELVFIIARFVNLSIGE